MGLGFGGGWGGGWGGIEYIVEEQSKSRSIMLYIIPHHHSLIELIDLSVDMLCGASSEVLH